MRIKELSQRSGMAASAIRFYEDEGLLPPVRRSDNGYRSYGGDHVERLRFIQRCRSLDMSLEDIRRMTGLLFHNDEADPDEVHDIVEEKLAVVDQRIAELNLMRGELLSLLDRCHHGHHHAAGEVCGMVDALRHETQN